MMKLAARIRQNRKMRIALVLCAGAVCLIGAVYLYFHNPYSYPLPCIFYSDAFCYNPLMTILLPLIGIYIAARAIDWMITGGNHIDGKISVKLLVWILIFIFIYGILRNIPVFPFNLLAPGGLAQVF